MLQQLALNYKAGQVMWAYSTLMLLAFLKDPQILQERSLQSFTIAAAQTNTGATHTKNAQGVQECLVCNMLDMQQS